MGMVTGAYAMSHILGAPDGVEAQSERVFAGMRTLGRELREGRPDVLVVLSSDHLNNFSLDAPMPFAIGVADRFVPYGDMGLPTDPIPGHRGFARAFGDFAAGRGFALGVPATLRPDHGVTIPAGIVDPGRTVPMVPLYINTVYDPAPTPGQAWALGGLLREFIAARRPPDERVALLAAGGLSHWLGVPQEGRVNEDWDRWFMQTLLAGDGRRLAALDNATILEQAGNGGLEVNAWIALAGAVPGARGRALFYEAIPAWASGMAGVVLDPASVGSGGA